MALIKDCLIKSIRHAAVYHKDIQEAPVCILWPDPDRQWESVLPALKADMPELFVLGGYTADEKTGPAIWLRCIISKTLENISYTDKTPVIYLPGISRQTLRDTRNCPEYLKPLASLQYQGSIWSQQNNKDWTVMAYLKSEKNGLGLNVAQDNQTKSSIILSLSALLMEELNLLNAKYLDKDFFNNLLSH